MKKINNCLQIRPRIIDLPASNISKDFVHFSTFLSVFMVSFDIKVRRHIYYFGYWRAMNINLMLFVINNFSVISPIFIIKTST